MASSVKFIIAVILRLWLAFLFRRHQIHGISSQGLIASPSVVILNICIAAARVYLSQLSHGGIVPLVRRLKFFGNWATRWNKCAISSGVNSVSGLGVERVLCSHFRFVDFFLLIILHDHVVDELIRQLT